VGNNYAIARSQLFIVWRANMLERVNGGRSYAAQLREIPLRLNFSERLRLLQTRSGAPAMLVHILRSTFDEPCQPRVK
jgi:hypothetical protein